MNVKKEIDVLKQWIMKKFWHIPIVPYKFKEKIYYLLRRLILHEKYRFEVNENIMSKYRQQVLKIPNPRKEQCYISINNENFQRVEADPKLIAYYLP